MIFTLVPLIFFRLGQSPVKNKLCSCAHTYTCTFTACVYTSHAHARLRARAHEHQQRARAQDRNLRRRSVCARTRPPGRLASNKNGVVLCLL